MKTKKKAPKDKLYIIAYPIYRLRTLIVDEDKLVRTELAGLARRVPIYLGESSKKIGYGKIRQGIRSMANIYYVDAEIKPVSQAILDKLSNPIYELQPAIKIVGTGKNTRALVKELILSKSYSNRKKLLFDIVSPAEYAEAVDPIDSN